MSEGSSTRRPPMWRGDSPTEPMPISDLLRRTPFRGAQPHQDLSDEISVAEALDLCARVGELMLRCGAGAPHVEGNLVAIATAAGLRTFELDLTLQSLHLQAVSASGRTHTVLRVVRSTRHDHARLVAVHELVAALVAGELSVEEARAELRRIKSYPRSWTPLAVAFANSTLASAVAFMIGASAVAAAVTIVVVFAVTGVNRLLARRQLPEFYTNAINALTATMLAGGAFSMGVVGWIPLSGKDFAYIVAGGIVAMLPGRTMAAAIEDALFGYPLTSAGRLLSVTIALIGLIIGVATGLSLLLRVTVALGAQFVSPDVLDLKISQAHWLAAVAGGFVVGLSSTVTVQSRRKLMLPAAALCALGVAALAVLTRVADVGVITATGLAAVLVGFVGRVVALRMNSPAMTLVVPASFGLLPGLTIFRGLYEMVAQSGAASGLLSLQSGITTLLAAAATLLAIATGTVFGEILATPLDRRPAQFRSR